MTIWIHDWNLFAQVWLASLWRASWQGGLALVLVWATCRVFIRLPPNVKVWLWRLAYLKLLVAFFWATPINLALLPASRIPATTAPQIAEATRIALPAGSEPVQKFFGDQTKTLPNTANWLFLFWLLGVLTAIARFCHHWRRTNWLRRSSRPVNDPTLNRQCRELAASLRIKTPPGIFETQAASRPVLAGILRSSVFLPNTIIHRFPPEQLRLILAHELAHVKRRDLLWMRLLFLGEVIFFFHPLLWLARRELLLAGEMACDELALRVTRAAPSCYGTILLDMVAQTRRDFPSESVLGVGIIETKQTLKRRLLAMKNLTSNSRQRMFLAFAALFILGAIGILPWRVVAQNSEGQEETTKLKQENAKLKSELQKANAQYEAVRQQSTAWEEAAAKLQSAKEKLPEDQKGDESYAAKFERLHVQLKVEREKKDKLLERYSSVHPAVVKQQDLLQELQARIESFQGSKYDWIDHNGRMAKAKTSAQQRDLLRTELSLAEQQAQSTRKSFDRGTITSDELLRVEREFFGIKQELAALESNKAEREELIRAEIKLIDRHLTDVLERVSAGTLGTGSDIPLRREILRLKRELMSLVSQ